VKIGSLKYKIRGYLPSRLAKPTEYEPHIALTVSRILQKRSGVFIDVGANVGQTLFTLLRVDPNRSYAGFEPQVACCHYLQTFIDDNKLTPRIQVFPIALSSSTGFFPFFSNNAQDVMGSLVPDFRHTQHQQFVCTRKGDEVMAELGILSISALKIDAEGAEFSILSGFQTTLKIIRPPVIFEVLPNFAGQARTMFEDSICKKRNAEADNVYQLLSSIGYSVFQIDPKSCSLFPIKNFNLDEKDNFRGNDYVAFFDAESFDLG
jgi:FkbM family methyltransferase